MSDGISAPFIRFPIGTSLMMAGILFVGLVAYPLLPVAPLPQVDFPTIQITATLPGATPETMGSSVARPMEREFPPSPASPDDVDSSDWDRSRHDPVRPQPEHRRGRTRRARRLTVASGQLPNEMVVPPTYRKVNPANSPILRSA